jgi:hypothetical protein
VGNFNMAGLMLALGSVPVSLRAAQPEGAGQFLRDTAFLFAYLERPNYATRALSRAKTGSAAAATKREQTLPCCRGSTFVAHAARKPSVTRRSVNDRSEGMFGNRLEEGAAMFDFREWQLNGVSAIVSRLSESMAMRVAHKVIVSTPQTGTTVLPVASSTLCAYLAPW